MQETTLRVVRGATLDVDNAFHANGEMEDTMSIEPRPTGMNMTWKVCETFWSQKKGQMAPSIMYTKGI
jgi:hypothetical protein